MIGRSANGHRERVLAVVGTRPEAIKMAPVVHALREKADLIETLVCASGQHGELLADALATFGLAPDHDLSAMRHDQQPADVAWEIARWVTELCRRLEPGLVVVQGDTATTMAAGLAAFYARVPVAHVEAGLRTYDNDAPWPEEVNRRIVAALADLHFAPSSLAAGNLRQEGIPSDRIHLTGNTGIDAVHWALTQPPPGDVEDDGRRRVLVTAHRRESIPDGIEAILRAVCRLAHRYPDAVFEFVVHPAPAVTRAIAATVGAARPPNLELLAPSDYVSFVHRLAGAFLVLTDSGGLQEEGPALGKPVLVVSHGSEREEPVLAGTSQLVGVDESDIVAATVRLFEDAEHYGRMAMPQDLYGDGHAAERIVAVLADALLPERVARGHSTLR